MTHLAGTLSKMQLLPTAQQLQLLIASGNFYSNLVKLCCILPSPQAKQLAHLYNRVMVNDILPLKKTAGLNSIFECEDRKQANM